ncbi:MAG: tetratricopeptide repeat protein [Proteobacteria bacterium]|nr:tetratricopeptide repeat protein [Pseudomonadota bacterium]
MFRLSRVLSATVVFLGCCAVVPAHGQVEDDLREGDRYFEAGKYKKAAQRYDSAIERSPGLVSADAYGQRAAIFIIQKNYRGGLQFITERAEAQHPDAPEVLEQKALILWLLGRRAEAIDTAESVIAQKPQVYSNQGIIGEFYAGRDPARAVRAYESYFRNRPSSLEKNDVLPRVRLGFSYLAVGRHRAAEAQFDILLKKHRKQPHAEVNARNGLCAAYAALGKYDRAITLCEQIVANPRHVDRGGSVWYNLGRAYLHKKQTGRARAAGNRFIRMRQSSPKGYLLVGDAYFQERNWARALQYYLDAEKLIKGGRASVDLGIKLGATYRRLNRPGDAITVLESVFAVNPNDITLASELGSAYLASRQDKKAINTVDRLIQADDFADLDRADRAALLLIAARALYNLREIKKALRRYRAAYKLRRNDIKVRIGLVQTINLQAYEAMSKGDLNSAARHLGQAYQLDRKSTLTNRNLAVLALSRKRCNRAEKYLAALAKAPGEALMYHRLLARAYLCQRRPNRARAAKHYALAEKYALDPNLQANLLRAEIYTEWAPLLLQSNLDDAIDKLKTAAQLAARNPEVGRAARRNLALASYRRGWRNMRAGKLPAAVEDFQIATRDANLLRGTETRVFEFSLAMAHLENGESNKAIKLFNRLIAMDQPASFLKPPYDAIGLRFFAAYAKYRSGNSRLQRQAAQTFSRLQRRGRRPLGGRLRDLTASTWLYIAGEAYRTGGIDDARQALKNAARYATSSKKMKRVTSNNRIVLAMARRGMPRSALATLRGLAESVPEALVNLGILYDRLGKSRVAYDHWIRARQSGIRVRSVQQWIDTKKRMYGF